MPAIIAGETFYTEQFPFQYDAQPVVGGEMNTSTGALLPSAAFPV